MTRVGSFSGDRNDPYRPPASPAVRVVHWAFTLLLSAGAGFVLLALCVWANWAATR